MHLVILLSSLLSMDIDPQTNPIMPRSSPLMIPMIEGTYDGMEWGDVDRTADHATVAINIDRNILVAFHSTRDDITDTVGTHLGFHEPLKQVEIAFFLYDSQNGQWELTKQKMIGSTEFDPRPSNEQDFVRCERPDVIAVGERFFVVWTRRYDRDQPGYEKEPAILECAWVEWNDSTSTLDVYNGGLAAGLGYPLDTDYWVRECAGVPDAVLLEAGSTSSTVGVVYPHQSDFGDIGPTLNTRLCDLRLVVTSLTHSSHTIPTPDEPFSLVDDIIFDGPTAPPGQVAAGLILPDCARALPDPVSGAYRFWLAYEEQLEPLSGNIPDGRIRLGLVEQTATGWGTLGTHTFGVASSPFVRRRPNVSSYPEDANGQEIVSIAFGKTNTTSDDDIVFQEWRYDPEDGLFHIPPLLGHAFVNNGNDHTRPIPLHGRTSPLVRRLYFVSHGSSSELREFDVDTADTTVMRSTLEDLGRPAVAYWAGSGSVPDDVVLTWEERAQGVTESRIWLRVD